MALKVAIVGMGNIGRQVARRARGFDMTVLYHNRTRNLPAEAELGATYATLPDLLGRADYVTLSPIFLSDSKPGYGPALGLEALRAVSAVAAGPVIALAGIDATNAAQCLAAGASGVAVMGEVMRSADPKETVRRLLRAIAST